MFYEVYSPSGILQDYIDSYYIFEADNVSVPARVNVSPTGSVGMVFVYGEGINVFNIHHSGDSFKNNFIFGQITRYVQLEFFNNTKFVGIHFKPLGFYALFKISPAEFQDRGVGLEDVFHDEDLFKQEQLINAESHEARIRLVDDYLLKKLKQAKKIVDCTYQAIKLISESDGVCKVTDLANLSNVSRRTLERKFLEKVGVYPKIYSEIKRFNATLSQLNLLKEKFRINYTTGYFDQAHFIKDFKRFTGNTPTDYLVSYTQEIAKALLVSCKFRFNK